MQHWQCINVILICAVLSYWEKMLTGSSGDSWAGCLSWVKPEPLSSSGEECNSPKRSFFNNVVICTSRLHWWVWDYWWPQSRKNRRQSHRQAEQGKLCFSWPSLTLTFMSLLVRQFQANAHNVWISCVGINHELSWNWKFIFFLSCLSNVERQNVFFNRLLWNLWHFFLLKNAFVWKGGKCDSLLTDDGNTICNTGGTLYNKHTVAFSSCFLLCVDVEFKPVCFLFFQCGVISPRFDLQLKDLEKWQNNLLPSRQFGWESNLLIFELNCGSDVVLNPLDIHFVFATPHYF